MIRKNRKKVAPVLGNVHVHICNEMPLTPELDIQRLMCGNRNVSMISCMHAKLLQSRSSKMTRSGVEYPTRSVVVDTNAVPLGLL